MRPRQAIVSYAGAHMRVRRIWGSASRYTCPCGEPARQWAYQHDDPDELTEDGMPYSIDPAHYRAMCLSCHRTVDAKLHCPHGHEYTPGNTIHTSDGRKCRTCVQARDRIRVRRPMTVEQKRRKVASVLARRARLREENS